MNYGAYVTWKIDSQPGGQGPFAPPPGWLGDREEYIGLMRKRWADRCYTQDFLASINCDRYKSPDFRGPYADSAKEIWHKLKSSFKTKEVENPNSP